MKIDLDGTDPANTIKSKSEMPGACVQATLSDLSIISPINSQSSVEDCCKRILVFGRTCSKIGKSVKCQSNQGLMESEKLRSVPRSHQNFEMLGRSRLL